MARHLVRGVSTFPPLVLLNPTNSDQTDENFRATCILVLHSASIDSLFCLVISKEVNPKCISIFLYSQNIDIIIRFPQM